MPSLFESDPEVLDKMIMKICKIFRQTDRRTTGGQKSSQIDSMVFGMSTVLFSLNHPHIYRMVMGIHLCMTP